MILSPLHIDNIEVKLDNEILEKVNVFKYLGIDIDDKLGFNSHITQLNNKLSKFCGLSYRLGSVYDKITALLCFCKFNLNIWTLCLGRQVNGVQL